MISFSLIQFSGSLFRRIWHIYTLVKSLHTLSIQRVPVWGPQEASCFYGDRRYAHWGKAHRKKAHGNLHIRLLAHPDTCTLGYLHIRGFAHSVSCTLGALHTELCTLLYLGNKNIFFVGCTGVEPAPYFSWIWSHAIMLRCTPPQLQPTNNMKPNW